MPAKLLDADEAYELGIEAGRRELADEEDVQPERATPPSSGVHTPSEKFLAFLLQIRERERERAAPRAPAPAPKPSRTPAPSSYHFDQQASTHEQRERLHKVRGLSPPEPPGPDARPWASSDPIARRERVRGWERNEILLSYLEHEAAQTEAARIAKLEGMRKNLRNAPIHEIQEQMQRMGFDRTIREGDNTVIAGLLDGVEIRDEPGSFALPPVRGSPTQMDELQARAEQRRRRDEAPAPEPGTDDYEVLLEAGVGGEAVAPATQQPQPAAPAPTHARKMSAAAFRVALRKFGIR